MVVGTARGWEWDLWTGSGDSSLKKSAKETLMESQCPGRGGGGGVKHVSREDGDSRKGAGLTRTL